MTSVEIVKMVMSNAQVSLSRDSIHALADVLIPKKYKKGECVLNEGEVCDCLRVIEKGMLRQYYFKYDKELTEHIAYEWGTVVCLQSYIEEKPTTLLIETLEPTILWEFPKKELERLSLERADIGVLYRRFFEMSLIDSQIKADIIRFEPAHERYMRLLRSHPEILKRAPLLYIASLLQMTPETLSRVRSGNQ